MNYKQLQNKIYESIATSGIKRQMICYGHAVAEAENGTIFVDRRYTEFASLKEATDYIKDHSVITRIDEEIQKDLYKDSNVLAHIIREHHKDVRVTDTLIESYSELAASKIFTIDRVVHDLRRSNKLDRLLEGRFDYKLNDGSTIVIKEETQEYINNILEQHQDVVEYMRENKENFLSVLEQLED